MYCCVILSRSQRYFSSTPLSHLKFTIALFFGKKTVIYVYRNQGMHSNNYTVNPCYLCSRGGCLRPSRYQDLRILHSVAQWRYWWKQRQALRLPRWNQARSLCTWIANLFAANVQKFFQALIQYFSKQSVDSYKRVESKAIERAKTMEAEYWSISAKTGENIQSLFSRIAAMAFDSLMSKEIEAHKDKRTAKDIPIAPSISKRYKYLSC